MTWPERSPGGGLCSFRGSERARELGPWRSDNELETELDQSLASFRALFGRNPTSVVAPDYTWDDRMESLWESRGLVIIQGKREQRNPVFGSGLRGRIRKYIGRRLDQTFHPERCYLERNCRLETAQAPDPDLAVLECLASVERAWSRGQPAIVETHRVNYSHTDADVVRIGTWGLEMFLTQIMATTAGAPVFLVDAEVAQLSKYGTSVCRRGASLVLRNGTHSRKLLPLPERGPGAGDRAGFLALEPGQEVVLKFVD